MVFRTSDINQLIDITRYDGDTEPITVIEYFRKTVEKFPSEDALAYKDTNENWVKINYEEYHRQVEKLAKVFIKMGLKQRGVVAILAWNSPKWVITALAAIHAGGVITAIYTTSSVSACKYILENSQSQIVVVDDEIQLEKINKIKSNLHNLHTVIETSKWDELMEMKIELDIEREYGQRLKSIFPNQCCSIIYTSGSTSFPKGAMLSHDNLIWDATESVKSIAILNPDHETIISYLPLSHLAAFMGDIFIAIHLAATVYFADFSALKENLLQYLQEIQPTFLVAVPRVYEKIEEKVKEKIEQLNFFKRKVFSWAQNVILENQILTRLNGNEKQSSSSMKLSVAMRFVSDPIKSLLGFQRCKLFFTGSAPISEETKKFFMSLDMFLNEVYGMTESSTVHIMSPMKIPNLKTVGKDMAFGQTKIMNKNEKGEGEICMKGRNIFMGYLNDIEKTVEAIDDNGWLHSGDIGYIDSEGFVYIKGRIKEIIITSGGENIPAVLIENSVKNECKAISNALLVGDKRQYLTILLTLKTEINNDGSPSDNLASETLKWLKILSLNYSKLSEVIENLQVRQALQDIINKVNSSAISNPQKIQKFTILPHDFSMITGELTPTLKVKRHVILEMYRQIIDELYS